MMTPELRDSLIRPEVADRVKRELWSKGSLRYMLHHDLQRRVYDFTKKWKEEHPNSALPIVWDLHRAAGKTFMLALFAVERGFALPGREIRFAAESQTTADQLVEPNLRKILDQRPKGFIAEPKRDQGCKYYLLYNPDWPPGSYPSRVWIVGCKEKADHQRGKRSHDVYFDECRNIKDFEYIAKTVFGPHFAKMDDPLCIMSSTPPESMDHAWSRIYCEQAAADHRYFKGPVVDTSDAKGDLDWTQADDERMEELFISKDTAEWRREMLCAHISDPTRLLVPEYDDVLHVVEQYERPKHFFPLVVADGGYIDFFACLFGYVDFVKQKLVVEDSFCYQRKNLGQLAGYIRDKERFLYADLSYDEREEEVWTFKETPQRHADMTPIELAELRDNYKVNLLAADHHDPDAQIAYLRDRVAKNQIVIVAHNVTLRRQLRNAIRDENGKLTRSEEYGHWDAVMALVYMAKVAPWLANPFPREIVEDITYRQVRKSVPNIPAFRVSRADLLRRAR